MSRVSNTLGTAPGDFVATDTGLGFERGALIFAGLIALVAAMHFLTKVPDSVLFGVFTEVNAPSLVEEIAEHHARIGSGVPLPI